QAPRLPQTRSFLSPMGPSLRLTRELPRSSSRAGPFATRKSWRLRTGRAWRWLPPASVTSATSPHPKLPVREPRREEALDIIQITIYRELTLIDHDRR